ncbi:MAG: hypothetical protein WCF22_14235 [Candidatus Sulfotelmatobacter sp.]
MSYDKAAKYFADSIRACDSLDARLKPVLWNLSKGLHELATALENDQPDSPEKNSKHLR